LEEYGAKVSGISAHEDGNMMKVTVFHNDVDSFWVNSFTEDEVFVGGVYHFGIKTKCACYTDLTFPRTVSKLTVNMELCH
jgi:hypothetical protein